MDQLYTLVAEKAGISAEQAKTAVETVIDFVQQQLPEPLASQVTAMMSSSGGAVDVNQLNSMLGGLGGLAGLFGGKH